MKSLEQQIRNGRHKYIDRGLKNHQRGLKNHFATTMKKIWGGIKDKRKCKQHLKC